MACSLLGSLPEQNKFIRLRISVLTLFTDVAITNSLTYHQHYHATTDKRPFHANASVKHLPARSLKSKIVKM